MNELRRTIDGKCAKRFEQGGFSLIELSIVLVVMGLLLLPFIKAYDVYQTQKRLDDTKIALSLVNTALANFYAENGYYPCPANRSLGFDELGHGEEECGRRIIPPATTPNPAAGFQVLTADGCQDGRGWCRSTNATGDLVYSGSVPYVTLGIPSAHAMDGWKNMLTYAVTATMTEEATFDPDEGAVEVVSELPASPVTLVHGILVSSGSDGVGGFNTDGQDQACTAGTRQVENCDDDARFMNSILFEAEGATYFDDIVVTNDWSRSGIWAYIDGTRVHNTNPGNIGIGTDDPTVRLDVVGAIRSTDNIQSPEFCETDPTTGLEINCFEASDIGGSGMDCNTTGAVAYGISNRDMDCRAPNVAFGSCPANQYVYGIAGNGAVMCRAFP